ncbi:unnamed protein product, partial [Closterium sp. NIES-53]
MIASFVVEDQVLPIQARALVGVLEWHESFVRAPYHTDRSLTEFDKNTRRMMQAGVRAVSAPSGKHRSGRGGRGGRGGGGGGGGGGGAGGVGVEAVEVVVGAAEALGAVEGAAAAVGEEGAVVALVVRANSSRSISVNARPPLPSSFLTGMPGVGLLG